MKNVAVVVFVCLSLSLYAQEDVAKNTKKEKTYTSFDLQKPVHSIGLLVSENFSFMEPKQRKATGTMEASLAMYFTPQFVLKYSCAIKNGWGITVEIPFGSFYRRTLVVDNNFPEDTIWSNVITGKEDNNSVGLNTYYVGLSLKASHLANVHKNVSLQSEMGLKWLPFTVSAKKLNTEPVEFTMPDGNGVDKLVYMNLTPSVASYAIPDFGFSFNVLVHGKNPAHNFVFGINGNISFVDRINFKYQTTDVLPTRLQSSGEFGWRTSSIGLHIGYQWMSGTKR